MPTRSKPIDRACDLMSSAIMRSRTLECEHFFDRQRIQDALLVGPASLRRCDAVWQVCEVVVIVRVGADNKMHTHFPGLSAEGIAEIQSVKVGVDLEASPGADGLFHHGIEVEFVGVAITQQPSSRV